MASADGDGDGEFDDCEDEPPRPSLQQRFSPFATVQTTVHAEGLVIQVNRLFRQSTVAVGFDRLVLDPSSLVTLRPGLLWSAGAACACGLLVAVLATPALGGLLAGVSGASGSLGAALRLLPLLAPALLVAGILVLLVAMTHPRRVSLFLDREAGMHPTFLRGGTAEADAEAAAFVEVVRRAIIDYRCRPPDADDAGPAPRVAATLDALLTMQRDELLSAPELAFFRELALRR